MTKKGAVLVVCTNRKAYHDYFIEDTYEAGLELLGAEVKSIRQKELSLEGSFVRVENDFGAFGQYAPRHSNRFSDGMRRGGAGRVFEADRVKRNAGF